MTCATPTQPSGPPHRQPPVDVVVVGAGLSGLTAARELRAAGLSVRLLEAAPQAGGRMRRTRLEWPGGGAWVDLGGQWVGPTQTRMLALLDHYGLGRFPSPHDGETVLVFRERRCSFRGFFQGFPEGQPPAVAEDDWHDAMAALERFNALAASLPSDRHPQEAPGANDLDRLSFQDWIDANTHTPSPAGISPISAGPSASSGRPNRSRCRCCTCSGASAPPPRPNTRKRS